MQVEAIDVGRMPVSAAQASRYRSVLLALAIVFALATTVYSIAWMYYVRFQVEVEIGMDTKPQPYGVEVAKVWPDSPALKAGLRSKDVIVAINGRSTERRLDSGDVLNEVWLRSHPGETAHLTIQRAGEPQPAAVDPVFRRMEGSGDTVSLARRGANQILGLYPLLFLVVGLAVLFLRVEDRNAWLLALVFAGFITEANLPVGVLRAPETLRAFLYAYQTVIKSVLPGLFYFFFAIFPTPSLIERKLPWLKWALLATGACLGWGGIRHGDFEALPFVTYVLTPSSIGLLRLIMGYGSVVLGMISLLLNVFGDTHLEDRRKLKVMLWGTLIGVAPAIIIGLPHDLRGEEIPFWLVFVQCVFLFMLPLSFAYAVVKHRVMDIPVLLRRSARYFVVQRGFAILMLAISIGAILWFGQAFSRRFSGGSQTAIAVGATFGVLLISGAIQVHRRVRTRLDRAFFRSAYDAQQILENLASRTLTVTDREGLAVLLHQHILDALHPTLLYVYLLAGDRKLHAYAGDRPETALVLSTGSGLLRSLTERGGPLEVNPDVLRASELQSLQAECLVPILGSSDGQLQGLAVLGPRLSEEPYSTGDKRLLASVASQAGIAMRSISLAERMAESMEAERRSEQEMQIARQVQSRLLPQHAPLLATLDCAGKCIQTRAVGGDYYDFLDFGSGRLGLVLADISGKGISAALLMANLQANLRSQYALALEDIPRLLKSVNQLFYKNTETSHYATTFFAVYDDDTRLLRYVNCGHNAPILLRTSGDVERLEATATVLGLFEHWECQVAERQLSTGDLLLIYTDGVSEASPSEESEEFGEDRMIAQLKAGQNRPAEEILETMVAKVQSFSQGEQADDMTLIVGRCRARNDTDRSPLA